MKDFTKTQEKRNDKVGAMKCNTCNTVVNAFGVHPGDRCIGIHGAEADIAAHQSDNSGRCPGKYMKIDDKSADNAKRRTDGAA